ncbi:BZ3500_MvSof-1268-A1-R1_Chr5-2g07880 [Microbotryum saponariae]|uniref:BZ3500_MvSof-1268-A1-R1_Chr5-2g07880 protein n=1 Tax=Microbotryum saponariae TaxID=289078 RepID=A0A2X0KFZ8_9BASI|nr:BZ3500_MvSof-1268-A1-R1_Chr5-2g07880 [Microbotryum saponariae]SDA05749.1 BZ3501_MvSof-1269-A2-R1_Chr5-2g07702 [Microbotryum saponariae]
MAEFSRLVVPRPPRTSVESEQKSESVYWKSYKARYSSFYSPIFIKSYAPVTHVQFSPSSPHRYIVTSGSRLQIYSPKTNRVVKTIARFKETATSGELRHDGKLCIAGDHSGAVQVFDINSRAILRTIKAHKQTVHTTKFSPGAGTQILTTSSDTTVRLFDLSTSANVRIYPRHTDYVRCASFVPSSPSLVFSGAYDGTVRLWDSRQAERDGQVWLGKHGKPVDEVLVGDNGTLACSAGGPILRVWDLLGATTSSITTVDRTGDEAPEYEDDERLDTGTSYCVRALSNHQKSITSLCWAEAENGEKRVLSGALDGLVKVYDPQNNWKVRHTMRYGGQVMSLAISPNSSHLVAGLSDGSLSIRTRVASKKAGLPTEFKAPSYDALLAGAAAGGVVYEGKEAMEGMGAFEGEQKMGKDRKKKLMEWDRMLKDFRYGDALDSVLRKVSAEDGICQAPRRSSDLVLDLVPQGITTPTTFALLEELIHRDGLTIALANRNDLSLEPILKFLVQHITNPRHCILASDVANALIEIYTPTLGLSPLVDGLFNRLRRKVDEELRFQRELMAVRGALDMVFASSQQGNKRAVAINAITV